MTIDVWDTATLDPALAAQLDAHADLIRDYLHTDHEIFLSHDLGRGAGRSILRQENPYADDFYRLKETIGHAMDVRVIRAFHYTRLIDDEVARSEEHTSELQSLMRISYAVFCLKKQKTKNNNNIY